MLEHLDIRNLATSNYQFFRRFLEFMELKTLYYAYQANPEIQHYSRFRAVDSLLVERGDPSDDRYVTYSEMMTRPRKLTPLYHLAIHFGPHIDPKALAAKMNQQCYRTLEVYGHYTCHHILDFLHVGISTVKLYGEMQMSEDDVMAFYPELLNYLIPEFNLFNDNCNEEWVQSINLAAWFHTHPDYCYLLDVNNGDGGMKLRMVLDSSGAKSLDHSSGGPFDNWSGYLDDIAGFDMENGDEDELEDSDDENNDFDDLPIDNDDE